MIVFREMGAIQSRAPSQWSYAVSSLEASNVSLDFPFVGNSLKAGVITPRVYSQCLQIIMNAK